MATNATSLIPFSGSTQGKPILLATTSTPGTMIHTTGISATVVDELWIYLFNSHTADVVVTIEFGGVDAPDQNIVQTVPFNQGLVLAVPGLILLGNGAAALEVRGFADTTSVVTASGYVYRVTP